MGAKLTTLDLLLLILKLVAMFLVGAGTWALALYRLLAFERRRVNLLCSLVFIEEFLVLFLGVWLANHSDYISAVALAFGGMMAARYVVNGADKSSSSSFCGDDRNHK